MDPSKKKKKNCFFFVFHLVFDIRSGFSINLNDALLSLVIMRVALLTRTFLFRSSNSRRLIKDKIVLPLRGNHGRRRIVVWYILGTVLCRVRIISILTWSVVCFVIWDMWRRAKIVWWAGWFLSWKENELLIKDFGVMDKIYLILIKSLEFKFLI